MIFMHSLWTPSEQMIDGFLTDHQRNYAQLLLFYIVPGYAYIYIYVVICISMYILFSDQPHISVPGPVSNCRCGVRRSDQVSTLRSCLRAAMVKDIIPTLHVRIRGAVEIRMFIICSLYPLVI